MKNVLYKLLFKKYKELDNDEFNIVLEHCNELVAIEKIDKFKIKMGSLLGKDKPASLFGEFSSFEIDRDRVEELLKKCLDHDKISAAWCNLIYQEEISKLKKVLSELTNYELCTFISLIEFLRSQKIKYMENTYKYIIMYQEINKVISNCFDMNYVAKVFYKTKGTIKDFNNSKFLYTDVERIDKEAVVDVISNYLKYEDSLVRIVRGIKNYPINFDIKHKNELLEYYNGKGLKKN